MGFLDWLIGFPLYVMLYGPVKLWCWLRGVNYPSGTPIKEDPPKPVFLDFEDLERDGDS